MGGMLFSLNGCPKMAVVCLAVSGFCDMFDGKIARTKKNRTEVEKRFGIQIDSLADIICFGVAPSLIAYRMGMNHIVGIAILMFYVLAGLIRLAWFNVSKRSARMGNRGKQEMLSGPANHFYGNCTPDFGCIPSAVGARIYYCTACTGIGYWTFIYYEIQTP